MFKPLQSNASFNEQTGAQDPIEGVLLASVEHIRRAFMAMDGIDLDIHEADRLGEAAIVTALGIGWRPPVN